MAFQSQKKEIVLLIGQKLLGEQRKLMKTVIGWLSCWSGLKRVRIVLNLLYWEQLLEVDFGVVEQS